ncbi:helix-turn-helix domain-containing protein [Alkaliphilus sp. MSJ-5]|uniref:Helix-turn-helix domain-containing protein n=1 Tax=Alkaliphilus flagellatus TaxID=2841507 RepID=A0ABS6G137_9FIRM|nr:helix-turn-helix domain-containing protein [Alkaliphilus flagellatus]
MQVFNIPISSDLQEITRHGTKDFPIAIYKTQLSKNILGHVPLHWHDEIQFVLVVEGSACFTVNQTKHYIHEKNGLFINSSCLHSATSHNSNDCVYICFDISPNFFSDDNIVQQKFVAPFINSKSIPFIELNISNPWQKEILEVLNDLFEIYTSQPFGYELGTYSSLFHIWHSIVLNTPDYMNETNLNILVEDNRIKDMLSFIHQNYMNKIVLEDIAKVGNISRSECCRFFKRMIKTSPIEYLITYRLNQSINLLKRTDLNITEIASEVGFGSVSYYIEQFRKHTNLTPKEYRECGISILKSSK